MDVLNDNSFRTWTKIASVIGESAIPDYVMQYTPPDSKSASSMSDAEFADPGKRTFPINSRAATWLSAAYMMDKQAQFLLDNPWGAPPPTQGARTIITIITRSSSQPDDVTDGEFTEERGDDNVEDNEIKDREPEDDDAEDGKKDDDDDNDEEQDKEACIVDSMLSDSPEERLMHACRAWGIEEDINKLARAYNAHTGQVKSAGDAADTDDYGWIVKDASGRVTAKRYGVFDASGLYKASEYFARNRKHYPRDVRAGIAQFLLKKAGEYGVDLSQLPGSVMREAGYGIPSKPEVMYEINERARLAKDAEAGMLLANVNYLLYSGNPEDIAAGLDKLAEIFDDFDHAEGLTRYYDTRITNPADFLAGVPIKEAEAFIDNTVKLKGFTFDASKLVNAPCFHKAAEVVMGPDFAKQARDAGAPALADMLRSLPPADRSALERAIVDML